jgi:hypothetical protein
MKFTRRDAMKLHSNLALVANSFYVSCADYETDDCSKLDVDFMVAEQDGYYAVFQSVIHMHDNKMRVQHMENAQIIFAKDGGCCAGKCAAKCGAKCAAKCGAKYGAAS